MILSDCSIKEALADGRLAIDPLDPNDIQPASVDVHLWPWLARVKSPPKGYIDPRDGMGGLLDFFVIDEEEPWLLMPNAFILGCVSQPITVPDDMAVAINGKSSLARAGLLVHITAGFADPGWHGRLTLELKNLGEWPIALRAGMPICQLGMWQLSTPAERPYGTPSLGSHYQGDMAAVGNRPLKG